MATLVQLAPHVILASEPRATTAVYATTSTEKLNAAARLAGKVRIAK